MTITLGLRDFVFNLPTVLVSSPNLKPRLRPLLDVAVRNQTRSISYFLFTSLMQNLMIPALIYDRIPALKGEAVFVSNL